MIAVVDYGVGNLFSLVGSLKALGLQATVTADPAVLQQASHIILPGVGAFGDAVQKLKDTGLIPILKTEAASGKPLLGICLGMQMLFQKSYEYGEHNGLGLIAGNVCPIEPDLAQPLKVPHIGWNALHILKKDNPLLKYTREGDYVYYVHSFYAKDCPQALVAVSEYGVQVPGVVANGNVYGTQFHPEKSGNVGLKMLKAFSEI